MQEPRSLGLWREYSELGEHRFHVVSVAEYASGFTPARHHKLLIEHLEAVDNSGTPWQQ